MMAPSKSAPSKSAPSRSVMPVPPVMPVMPSVPYVSPVSPLTFNFYTPTQQAADIKLFNNILMAIPFNTVNLGQIRQEIMKNYSLHNAYVQQAFDINQAANAYPNKCLPLGYNNFYNRNITSGEPIGKNLCCSRQYNIVNNMYSCK
jgi:hypothetical protein